MECACHSDVEDSLEVSKLWSEADCLGREDGEMEKRSGTGMVPEKHFAVNT